MVKRKTALKGASLALAAALAFGVVGFAPEKKGADSMFDRLIADAYQLDPDSTTVLDDAGLKDPWKIGVHKEKFENESLYPAVTEGAHIVKLADFGDSVTSAGNYDDTAAFIAALEKVREYNGEPVVLQLPKDASLDFIEGMNEVDVNYGIVIDGIDNLTIAGDNTTLYFHGVMKGLHIVDCENFKMTGVRIDWGRVPFSMGKIKETDGKTFVVTVDDAYPVDGDTEIMGLLEYNARTLAPLVNGNDIYYTVKNVRLTGKQELTIDFDKQYKASPAGTIVVLRHQIYSYDAITVDACKNTYFENVDVYAAPGMGMRVNESENLYVNRFDIRLKPNTDRMMSVTADGIHLMETGGEVKVTNCLFENMGDDAMNVHGFYSAVTDISEDRKTISVVNGRGYNFSPKAGETLSVDDKNDFHTVDSAVVTAVEPLQSGGFSITFDKALSADVKTGNIVANRSRAPAFTFKNNIVRNKRCRGILIQTANKAEVIDNTFANLTDAGIFIAGDSGEWLEAMPSSNVTIKNNKIVNTNLSGGARGAITAQCLDSSGNDGMAGIMQNIVVENNLIANTGHGGMLLAAVDGLTIEHNLISGAGQLGQKFGVNVRKGKKVKIVKNDVKASADLKFKAGVAEETVEEELTVTDNSGLSADDFIVRAEATLTEVYKIADGAIDMTAQNLDDFRDIGTDIEMKGCSNAEQEPVELEESDFLAETVKFAYDNTGIYVAFSVRDDKISWVSGSYWNGDGVELFMTADTEYNGSTEALKNTDPSCVQMFMSAGMTGSLVVAARTSTEVLEKKDDIKMLCWMHDDGKGYSGKAFIPFSVVPTVKDKIDRGEAISLVIRFADSDADGASLVQISNVNNPVEMNKFVPSRMAKILFKEQEA